MQGHLTLVSIPAAWRDSCKFSACAGPCDEYPMTPPLPSGSFFRTDWQRQSASLGNLSCKEGIQPKSFFFSSSFSVLIVFICSFFLFSFLLFWPPFWSFSFSYSLCVLCSFTQWYALVFLIKKGFVRLRCQSCAH